MVDRVVELTPEQHKIYKEMLSQLKAEYLGGQITAANEAIKLNKLVQICLGTAYGPDGNISIPSQPRIDTLLEIIEEAAAKVIVFVPLTGALHALAEAVSQVHTVAVIHGGVSKTKRDDIFADFMSPHGVKVLIAQPGTMSHGLSLTAANVIVWYGPINSAEIFTQANARIVRPGQTRNTLIVRIQGSAIERKMYERLERKESMQGTLLDMFN
jgi:SNF2 family DNA or RNA helicase